jgi:hypothetical protein
MKISAILLAILPLSYALTTGLAPTLPNYYAKLELEQFETNSTAIQARTDVEICQLLISAGSLCVSIVSAITTYSYQMASLVKSDSDGNDCTVHSGSMDSVHWQYYATGRNCDTTAQQSTIAGAIAVYLESQSSEVCGVHCLELTHSGTWAGYLTLGPSSLDLSGVSCSNSRTFTTCVSGGKNDV